MLLSPRLDLRFCDLSDLVIARHLPSCRTLCVLHCTAENALLVDRVGDGLRLDIDGSNPRIIWPTIVGPVTKIAEPRLKCRRIMFRYQGAVGADLCDATDRGPLATNVEERDVDLDPVSIVLSKEALRDVEAIPMGLMRRRRSCLTRCW